MDAACYLEHSTDTVLCLPGFHLAPVLLHAWYQVYTQFHTSKSSQITPWSRTAALTWLPATCLASKSSVAFKVFSELGIKWPAIINQLCGRAVSGPPGQQSETCALGSPPGVRNVPDPNNGCTAGDVAWKKKSTKTKKLQEWSWQLEQCWGFCCNGQRGFSWRAETQVFHQDALWWPKEATERRRFYILVIWPAREQHLHSS